MLRSDGTGNFTETGDGSGGSFTGYQHANTLVAHMNTEFTTNQQVWLPNPNSTAKLPINIQYTLKGVYFDRNTTLYNESWSSFTTTTTYLKNRYSEINIFICRNKITGDPSGNAYAVNAPYGFYMVKVFDAKYQYHNLSPWWQHGTSAVCNHEVGHLINLGHPYSGADGCADTYTVPMQCWEYCNPAPTCCNWSIVSNTFMDYHAYEPAVTPCQIDKIHINLSTPSLGMAYVTTNPVASFGLPTNVMANCSGVAPSISMSASASVNETNYRYQIFKTSAPCGTANLGQYYDSGWKAGQAPDINLTSVYIFSVNNTYRVILTVKNNCDQTNELAKCVTIIPNSGACGLVLSPNPANTEVVATFDLNSDIEYSIDITRADNQAQHPIQAKLPGQKGPVKKAINLGSFASGNYYIIVTTPVNVITEKLVIIK